MPLLETAPRVEELPMVPLTAQVTAVFELPETVAVNWNESPARIFAEAGETVTEMELGVDGEEGDELFGGVEVAAQPARVAAERSAIVLRAVRITTGQASAKKECLRLIFACGEVLQLLNERAEEGQWSGGEVESVRVRAANPHFRG